MEPIVAIAIVTSGVLGALKLLLDYRRDRWKVRLGARADGDRSLGTGELRGMIREAVEEANAPLVARLEAVEQQADPDRVVRVGRLSA